MSQIANNTSPLCICGQSKNYPYCDGSHHNTQWSCGSPPNEESELLISTGPNLYNLAKRLAFKLGAKVCIEHTNQVPQKLLRLCDLSSPFPTPHIKAEATLNLALGVPSEFISKKAPHSVTRELPFSDPIKLYTSIIKLLKSGDCWSPIHKQNNIKTKRIFLSHAVSDQPKFSWLITQLRVQYELKVFVCSDSLTFGSQWYPEIIENLQQSDLMIQIITSAAKSSTFCAFEAGYAVAKEIPLLLLCYEDGTLPPAHLQHLQAYELWKLRQTQPWLNIDELALMTILETLTFQDNEFSEM